MAVVYKIWCETKIFGWNAVWIQTKHKVKDSNWTKLSGLSPDQRAFPAWIYPKTLLEMGLGFYLLNIATILSIYLSKPVFPLFLNTDESTPQPGDPNEAQDLPIPPKSPTEDDSENKTSTEAFQKEAMDEKADITTQEPEGSFDFSHEDSLRGENDTNSVTDTYTPGELDHTAGSGMSPPVTQKEETSTVTPVGRPEDTQENSDSELNGVKTQDKGYCIYSMTFYLRKTWLSDSYSIT